MIEENIEEMKEDRESAAEEVYEEVPVKEDYFTHCENVKQPDNLEAVVEGLLYIVGEDGARVEQLAIAIDKSLEDTRTILENIQEKYASELFGIELVAYGSVYKFISKKDVYPYAQELFGASKQNTLSQAALETLAIIAYKQPVTKLEIEKIRGVQSDYAVNRLVEVGLVEEVGRLEQPGRPVLFGTTEEFLRRFGLRNTEDLPDINVEKAEAFKLEAEQELGYIRPGSEDTETADQSSGSEAYSESGDAAAKEVTEHE